MQTEEGNLSWQQVKHAVKHLGWICTKPNSGGLSPYEPLFSDS